MPSTRYAFEPGGEPRIGVDWTGMWKNVAVTLDGQRLGDFADSKALQSGRRFALPDGTQLEVKLAQLPMPELRLLRDGVPLPGSPSDPQQLVRSAGQLICVLGALSTGLGLLVAALDIGFLTNLGFGLASALGSVVFGLLGLAVLRGSAPALGAAFLLYAIDGIALLLDPIEAGGTPSIGGIVMRVFLCIPMLRALPAALALRSAGVAVHRAPPAPAAAARTATPRTAPAARARLPQVRRELRFVAPKLELGPEGVCVVALDGSRRDLAFGQVAAVLVRRLPLEAPWSGNVLLELSATEGAPVRVLPTTLTNFAQLPGGAAPSRLENIRRLARLLSEKSPAAEIDPATRAFLDGKGVPSAFPTAAEFATHDARYP